MTKPPSLKSSEIDQFENLDLHQLESKLKQIVTGPPSPESKRSARIVRQALRSRQRRIKAKVMEFEQSNNHHLLLFDSTENFSKIAGHSVLFYTLTIADRIHRRFSIKNDTDDYSRSEEGIVSIRSLSQLEAQLASINIFPDRELSTTELHFYKLSKFYSDEQLSKLHDRSRQDIERITSIIIPKSPIPALYTIILELNRLIYFNCKRISDGLAHETLVHQMIFDANDILSSYLNYANARPHTSSIRHQLQNHTTLGQTPSSSTPHPSTQAQNLFNILYHARNLRNYLANMENLRLIHHRELCDMLEKIVEIEHITTREYNKRAREARIQKISQETTGHE